MKINYGPYVRTLEQQIEFDNLVAALRAKTPKRPPSTAQAESTMRTLARDPRDDFSWQNRPLPDNWKANPSATTIEETVGERKVDIQEITTAEAMRKRGHDNTTGQSTLSATTLEKRSKAVDAVIYTPGANVTSDDVERRAVNLVEYKSEPLKEVWVELTWWQALWHWARGNKVTSPTDTSRSRSYLNDGL